MTNASKIILQYVCPTLGCFVGNYMFLAPFSDVQNAVARGFIGDLNPLPWAFMLGNCIGWVLYSFLVRDFFVFAGNCPGMFIGAWLNLQATKLLYKKQFLPVSSCKDGEDEEEAVDKVTTKMYEAPRHDYYVMAILAAWTAVIAIVGFGESISPDTKQLIVGVCANFNVMFFYSAPLSTIVQVIKERNTASIHFKTMVCNTANGCFWTIYGFAVLDYYIFVPNGLGSLFGFVQIALYITYPRQKRTMAGQEQSEEGGAVAEAKQTQGIEKGEPGAPASGLTTRTIDDPSDTPLSL